MTCPCVSGRYLDRWIGTWENAYKNGTPFDITACDLGEFWLLDQFLDGRDGLLFKIGFRKIV